MLANATMLPNWIISGELLELRRSTRDGDHRRDRECAEYGPRLRVAANAAIDSWGCGAPLMSAIEYSTVSDTAATSMKFARLKASLIARWREPYDERQPRTRRARPPGTRPDFRKKKPMTAGNSLSENECVSRRKWTSTTFISAAANAAAMHRPWHVDTERGSGSIAELRVIDQGRKRD